MILLPPFLADIIISLVSVAYGIRWECHYTAWMSVFLNVVFTAIFLVSNDLPLLVIGVLLAYVALGAVIVKFNFSQLYSLFGTKTFGAMTLTASLGAIGVLNWLVTILNPFNQYINDASVFLGVWIIFGVLIHTLGWYYFGRK